VGLFGAVMLGLGSIIGSGVFVSLAVAAEVTGPAVLLAIGIGGVVAGLNGFSSAQLAANHPVSGGTYEYGYRYLNSWFGFTAGWAFLVAKSASAATAALAFAGYAIGLLGLAGSDSLRTGLALGLVVLLTSLVLLGMRRSNMANTVIVSITLIALGVFVVAGLPSMFANGPASFTPFLRAESGSSLTALLYASALMFVAFTGYGRIATLGEEVVEPRVTIPRAVIAALLVTAVVYALVAAVAVGAGGELFVSSVNQDPLVVVARGFAFGPAAPIVALGALTATVGVLLNLVVGLSRVALAMGRRRDIPALFGRLDASGTSPTAAVIGVGAVIAVLVAVGDVRVTWSLSAFTVLIYYSITNLAATRLGADERLYPRWLAVAGLIACLGLAAFVEWRVLLVGCGVLALGLVWHAVALRLQRS